MSAEREEISMSGYWIGKCYQKMSLFRIGLALFVSFAASAEQIESVAVSVNTIIEGFTQSDLSSVTLDYTVVWVGKPEFPNFQAYWSIEPALFNQGEHFFARVTSSPKKLSETTIDPFVETEESRFLSSSELIQVNHPFVNDLAESISSRESGSSVQIVREILRKLPDVLRYPETDGLLPLRNTEVILQGFDGRNQVEGECKSFSNLFVAIARNLGVPARIVSGFKMSEYGALGHYWVEAYLGSGNGWVPIEPQYENGDVTSAYLPDGIVDEFEKTVTDSLVYVLKGHL